MVPKVIPESERKQPVSISLTAVEIVMLNKLAESNGKNRSEWLAGIIRASAQIKMGLSELETHAQTIQGWRPRLSGRINHGNPGACNPHAPGGHCRHPDCVHLYTEWGVLIL